MKTKFLFTILLSIFLINSVSAIVVYGDWENGAQSIQITQGESADFNSDFFSMNPPMTINIKFYDSNYNVVHTFENNRRINANSYYHTYTITEQIYQTTGNFELVLSGSDTYPDSDSHTLYLRVVEGPEPNHPPIAYSTTTRINEDTPTLLTLLASDPDRDELTYIIVSYPQHGELTGNGQTRTYSPNANWYGTDSFTFKVYDGQYYSNTATVTIIVKSINDAPIITSTPITRVDEGKLYTYQVIAQDVENDELHYSLTQAPDWLSINSQTGLITGTAPLVDDDTTFPVSIKVSDASAFDVQSYNLVVKNIPFDNIPPEVIISYPEDGRTYNSHITRLLYTASDNVELEKCWYIINDGEEIPVLCNEPIYINSVEGRNTWKVYAQDTSGNIGSDSVSFFVEIGDTTPPEITIISPQDKEYDYSDILFKIRTNEATESAWFILDGGDEIRMNKLDQMNFEKILEVEDGEHEVVFYAKDLAGNIGTKSIRFSVDTEKEEKKARNIGVRYLPYDDFYELKYLSQFAPPRVIYEEVEKETPLEERANLIWLIISFLLLIAIIIILIILALSRRRR